MRVVLTQQGRLIIWRPSNEHFKFSAYETADESFGGCVTKLWIIFECGNLSLPAPYFLFFRRRLCRLAPRVAARLAHHILRLCVTGTCCPSSGLLNRISQPNYRLDVQYVCAGYRWSSREIKYSFRCLSCYRSIDSSKTSSPQSDIYCFRFQFPVSSPFLKVIQ